jgi:hypothetical protein
MNSLIIYLTLLLCTLNIQVHCSYPLTVEGDNLPLPPHLFSTSTVVYNDTIYSYGGNIPFKLWGSDKLFTYTLDPSTGKMVVRLENEDNGPICAFCNAVLFPDSNEILVFSGQNYNETSIFYNNQTIWQPNQTVLPHFYDLKEKTWKVTPPTQRTGNDDIFYLRHSSTTVMNGNDGVYILGGYISYYGYRRDGWYYNRHDNSYTPISLPNNNTYIDAIGYIDL